jgi:hypothetical protein
MREQATPVLEGQVTHVPEVLEDQRESIQIQKPMTAKNQ